MHKKKQKTTELSNTEALRKRREAKTVINGVPSERRGIKGKGRMTSCTHHRQFREMLVWKGQ